MNKNDEKIVLLKKKLEEKRNELDKVEPSKHHFRTNLMFDGFGRKMNLNTIGTANEALEWRVWLNTYCKSALDLGFEKHSVLVSNFTLEDWCYDLDFIYQSKLYQDKKKEFNKLAKRLDELLSNDKKVELELEDIADILNL